METENEDALEESLKIILEEAQEVVHDYIAQDSFECVICFARINKELFGWDGGYNPDPVKTSGRCCYECDQNVVIPARIAAL